MRVLGIETSADDTGIALIEAKGAFGPDFSYKILGNVVHSQKIHEAYGGIHPNLAKNEHTKNLPAVLDQVLRDAHESASRPKIDAIAVTHGPGIEPCLWTGINFAQKLSEQWSVPIVPVNHMEGHMLVSMMENGKLAHFDFPAIALLISGGHTELILMKSFGQYEYIGRTRDDAVGEAFDKVARMIGLPYPGGPPISKLAEKSRCNEMTSHCIRLPRPMMNSKNFDFSFSGLKTAVLRFVQTHSPLSEDQKANIAQEFEDAVTEVLVGKTLRAVEEYGACAVVIGGGVSANRHIRAELNRKLAEIGVHELLVCPPEFSTDNGLMIALAGYFHALKKEFTNIESLTANGNLDLC